MQFPPFFYQRRRIDTMALNSNSRTTPKQRARKNGFSLIELLIVVAIILIIAAIAIPNLLRARMAANEAGGAANSRTISSANVAYAATYGNGYAATLGTLGAPGGVLVASCNNAILIDQALSNNGAGNVSSKSGYTYTYGPGNVLVTTPPGCLPGVDGYTLDADPLIYQITGVRRYFVDPSGVIRFTSDGSAPNNLSTPLQ